MSVEPVTPLLGFEIRQPDNFGCSRQVGFGNANGADLVIVGVSLFEFAHLTAFQDQRFSVDGSEASRHFKAVAGGFQDDDVVG